MWARRAAWWAGRVWRALVALPSLLAVAVLLYSATVYCWYFISRGGLGALPLVGLAAASLVAVTIACVPVVSWIRRLCAGERTAPLAARAAHVHDADRRDEQVLLVDILWAVAPVVWPALPLAIGISVVSADSHSLEALLRDPSSRLQILLFGTLVLTYATMWISWVRFIIRRRRGVVGPASPGMRLLDPHLPAGSRRPTALLTAVLLISTVLSLLQFAWYMAATLLLL